MGSRLLLKFLLIAGWMASSAPCVSCLPTGTVETPLHGSPCVPIPTSSVLPDQLVILAESAVHIAWYTNGRVARVGEEHRNAARRRAWVRREDERMEEDSQAHWLANIRMRGVFRGRENFVTNL